MTHEIWSVICGDALPRFPTPTEWHSIDNMDNSRSPCVCYQEALDQCESEMIVYIHNDVTIHDPNWIDATVSGMCGNNVVAVGLGGALALGNKDLYRKFYDIRNMARRGYASNQTDAETHGERFTGWRRVAVIEQFFMAIRTDWLRSIGGWPTRHLTHHCMDMWLACEAAWRDKQIWMTGISCTHHGGGSSTKPTYGRAKWLQGGSMETDHQIPHRWIWDNYRDVLPLEIA